MCRYHVRSIRAHELPLALLCPSLWILWAPGLILELCDLLTVQLGRDVDNVTEYNISVDGLLADTLV